MAILCEVDYEEVKIQEKVFELISVYARFFYPASEGWEDFFLWQ
jgi:hypothetical protein